MKFLVIAADTMSDILLKEQVEELGHTYCGRATSIDEALDEVTKLRPDIVIADPYFDSFAAASGWLEKLTQAARFDIILLGIDPVQDQTLFSKLGALGSIAQPPDPGALRQLLETSQG